MKFPDFLILIHLNYAHVDYFCMMNIFLFGENISSLKNSNE